MGGSFFLSQQSSLEGRPVKGMVGVSLMSHAFSHSAVQTMAEFALDYCQEVTVFIVDHPHRHNWPLSTSPSLDHYWQVCRRISDEKIQGYRRFLGFSDKATSISFGQWQTFFDQPFYCRVIARLRTAYLSNYAFQTVVAEDTRYNIGAKIADVEARRGRELSHLETKSLHQYVLEELAGLIYLQCHEGYVIDFYPGPPLRSMLAIERGVIPGFVDELGANGIGSGWVWVGE